MMESEDVIKQAVHELFLEEKDEYESYEQMYGTETPSAAFSMQMNREIRRFESRYRFNITIKRIAAVFAIVIAGYLMLFLINEDVRAYTIQFIRTHLFGGFTSYVIPGDEDGRRPVRIETDYVPEGFELESKAFHYSNGHMMFVSNDETKSCTMDIIYLSNPQKESNGIDNEHSIRESGVLEDGTPCDIYRSFTEGYNSFVIWKEGSVLLTACMDDYLEGWEVDELLKVANHVKVIYDE